MSNIWKCHADHLRDAAKEYIEAVKRLIRVQSLALADWDNKSKRSSLAEEVCMVLAAEHEVDCWLGFCDLQDKFDAKVKGSAK